MTSFEIVQALTWQTNQPSILTPQTWSWKHNQKGSLPL